MYRLFRFLLFRKKILESFSQAVRSGIHQHMGVKTHTGAQPAQLLTGEVTAVEGDSQGPGMASAGEGTDSGKGTAAFSPGGHTLAMAALRPGLAMQPAAQHHTPPTRGGGEGSCRHDHHWGPARWQRSGLRSAHGHWLQLGELAKAALELRKRRGSHEPETGGKDCRPGGPQ